MHWQAHSKRRHFEFGLPRGVASNSESWMRRQSGLGLVVAAKLVLGEPFRERGRDLEFPPLFLVW